MSLKNYLSIGGLLLLLTFFVVNCEKEVLHVADDQIYSRDSSYNTYQLNGDLHIDSIKISDCPGTEPYGEYPDVVFDICNVDGSACINTTNQVLPNVKSIDLPLTLIPTSPMLFDLDPNSPTSFTIKVYEFDLPSAYDETIGDFEVSVESLTSLQKDGINAVTFKSFHIAMTVYFRIQ